MKNNKHLTMSKKTKSSPTLSNDKNIEDVYSMMTQHEHVLKRPNTYIGSIKSDSRLMWIMGEDGKFKQKLIEFVPGLYKIYDEILVNANDRTIVDKTCTEIRVNIDVEDKKITVYNNGKGIPIEIHKEHNIYICEMLFGHLLSSSNYNDEETRIVGGVNGIGAKACNIFSKFFSIETIDKKKKYYQEFTNNMYDIHPPVITKLDKSSTSYTKITFVPDLEKFGMSELSDDVVSLFKKRVYDIAACTNPNVRVYLDNKIINISCFEDYIKMHYNSTPDNSVFEIVNDRWEIGVIYDPSESGFKHVSYVNSICTYQGGSHVEYICTQLSTKILKLIKDKHKELTVKPSYVKDNITLFIKSTIENPDFGSQSKDCLTTKVSSFGSTCDLSVKFIQKLSKTGIVDDIVNLSKFKTLKELNKTDGKKKSQLYDIPKLIDARLGGTRQSAKCSLFLTEGDSAKTFAINGFNIIGRDRYGVFPLKGKPLNVREATISQLKNNEEIKNLKQILALKQGESYDTEAKRSKLRYGKIILLLDQDLDGSHIKGLLINAFHFFWKDLLENGFIEILSTPIVKIYNINDTKRLKTLHTFYTLQDFETWEKEQPNMKKFKVKYYKGLGTFDKKEAEELFREMDKHLTKITVDDISKEIIDIVNNEENDNDIDADLDVSEHAESITSNSKKNVKKTRSRKPKIDKTKDISSFDPIVLAFDKQMSDFRKKWLQGYNKKNIIEYTSGNLSVKDFINKELIHFSNYDNIRSIPMIDGFKPSQRKVMYTYFKKKIDHEIKVAQLACSVAELTEYHHGEVSLQGTIVNLAHDFVGTNNINLLLPCGNFGSRLMGGKDVSSARYIFTMLNDITTKIFREEDNCIYNYMTEDNKQIEPECFAPIVPTILVNGTEGIGTGFSVFIPCFNPCDIINNLRNMLKKEKYVEMIPWYKGFKGIIEKVDENTYQTNGLFDLVDENSIKIKELPIGVWTDSYKSFLNSITQYDKPYDKSFLLSSFDDNSGTDTVDITLTFLDNILIQLIKENSLLKKLKLTSSLKTSNMNLCDIHGVVKHYDTIEDIMHHFFEFRYSFYIKRKEYHLRLLLNQLNLLKYRKQFIEYVLNKKIIIEKRSKNDIIQDIIKYDFPQLSTNVDATDEDKNYKYITDLQLFSLTSEKIKDYQEEYNNKKIEYDLYLQKTIEQIWNEELNEVENVYIKLSQDSSHKKEKTIKKKK